MIEGKILPNAHNMREIIRNIFSLSQKLKGNIPINSLDDAATLAANAYGFTSWREYKIALNKKNEKDINNHLILNNIENHFNQSPFEISKGQKLVECSPYILQNSLYVKPNIELINNKTVPKKWLIGKHFQKIGKIFDPKNLLLENSFILGSSITPIEKIFTKQLQWLDSENQSYVAFVGEMSSKDFTILENYYEFKKDINFIGKKHTLLNPIKELLFQNKLENLFSFNADEQSNYLDLILELINYLYQDKKNNVNIYELIKFTEIETLLNIYNSVENKKKLPRMLDYYLFTICKIKKSVNHYIVEECGYKTHAIHASYIKNVLLEIKMLYENGYFSLDSDCILYKALLEKEKLIIIKEDNINYQNIILNLYYTVAKCYENLFIEMNSNENKIWTLWWNAEDWINEKNQNQINDLQECFYMYYYINSNFQHLEKLSANIKQILFLKHNPYGYPQSMKENILNMTILYDINFWYDNIKIVRNLEENEAYLWQIGDSLAINKNFEDYKLEKIQLYEY